MKNHSWIFGRGCLPFGKAVLVAVALATGSVAVPLAGGLNVEVQGPEIDEGRANYYLVFQNDASNEAVQKADSTWVHRLADELSGLSQDVAVANSLSIMLEWDLEIDRQGDVATGWYLERGEDALHIRPGLFGADKWKMGDELVLVIGVPLAEGTQDIDLFASVVRAEHRAYTGERSYSVATFPAPSLTSVPQGAPPEAIPMQGSSGGLLLRWQSTAGHSYRLEHSPDLVNWKAVGQKQMGDGYPLQQLAPATENRAAFYRLRILSE